MRRFNYTGRIRLRKSDILITLYPREDGLREFEIVMDLDTALGASQETAAVFVEAYGGPKFERFPLGTVGAPAPLSRLTLVTFGPDENVLFRVKVVEADGAGGRIIAMATGIRPAGPTDRPQASLLPVSVAKLDGVVYK